MKQRLLAHERKHWDALVAEAGSSGHAPRAVLEAIVEDAKGEVERQADALLEMINSELHAAGHPEPPAIWTGYPWFWYPPNLYWGVGGAWSY